MLHRCVAIATLLILSATSAASAVEHPSELFSHEVSLVMRLKSPQATTQKVAEFADGIQPGFGQMVTDQAQNLGAVISNPTLAGVDQEQDWWLGVYATEDGNPTLVFVIPAKDMQAMKEAIDNLGGFKFIEHEKWGIYTADAWSADNIQERIDGKSKALVDDVDEGLQDTFERGDFSIFINVRQLAKVYENDIANAKGELRAQADNAPPGADVMIGMYLGMAEPLFQSLEDATGAVLTASVDKQGFTLEALGKAKADSETAKFLKSAPNSTPLLAKLPTGGQGYFAMSTMPKVFQEWGIKMMEASAELLEENDEAFEKVKEVMRRMQKLEYGGMAAMVEVNAEGDKQGLRTATIMEAAKPQQVRLLANELAVAQSGLKIGGVETTYEYTEDAEEIGKRKVDTLKVEQNIEQNPFFDMERIYDIFFGEEGMLTRIVYTDKEVIQTLGGGKLSMADLLNRFDQSTAELSAAAQTTRDALSKNANMVVLVDLPGGLSRLARLILNSGMVPFPIDPEAIGIPEDKSYFGLSVATEEAGVRVLVHLPTAQARNGYTFGMQVFQAIQDMQRQQF